YDLTVPFARFVAEHQNDLVLPFKKFQVDEVWRGEKPQKGRYRQFCQADVDIVGVDSLAADVEIILTLHAGLQQLAGGPFTMVLNSRPVLSGLLRKIGGVETPEKESAALIVLDKLAKVGAATVVTLLGEQCGVEQAAAEKLLAVVSA